MKHRNLVTARKLYPEDKGNQKNMVPLSLASGQLIRSLCLWTHEYLERTEELFIRQTFPVSKYEKVSFPYLNFLEQYQKTFFNEWGQSSVYVSSSLNRVFFSMIVKYVHPNKSPVFKFLIVKHSSSYSFESLT